MDTLLSGLIGAIIAVVLTSWFNTQADAKRRKQHEQDAAFVYMARLTSILATRDLVVKIAKLFIDVVPEDKRKELETDGPYLVSAVIARAINSKNGDTMEDFMGKLKAYEGVLDKYLKESIGFVLSQETLEKLPRKAIASYELYRQYYVYIYQLVPMIKAYPKLDDERSLAELLCSIWLALKQFSDGHPREPALTGLCVVFFRRTGRLNVNRACVLLGRIPVWRRFAYAGAVFFSQ